MEVAEDATNKFTVTADDGVRLYVDGQKVLDKWIPQSRTTFTVNRQLTAGSHQIVLEYFEAAVDAVAEAELRTEPPSRLRLRHRHPSRLPRSTSTTPCSPALRW